ncbi:MAG: HAMP domain-containing histidine kinase [Candidatus Hydrogenedentes bacterium]|nr:HAMP domain-containing histidine kinase [Candidatus Hydrogenedentota bacterium]
MKPKLAVIYFLIIVAPLAAVTWLGIVVSRNETAMVRVRFNELMAGRLNDIAAQISALLEQRERELMAQWPTDALTAELLRERARSSGIVRQYFVLDPRGTLLYPSPAETLTKDEQDFLTRTRTIWERSEIPGPETETQAQSTAVQQDSVNPITQFKKAAPPPVTIKGWHSGYWGSGIQLLFWWREESGRLVGAELNEVRLMADIVGLLPEASALPDARIELNDSQDAVVYQWGDYLGTEGNRAPVQLALAPPLGSWHLSYIVPDDSQGAPLWFGMASGIATLALACAGLAVYFYRENTRALREAQQRVTFVNQVSHELKTPLTNIRMYAEVLQEDLSETDERIRRRLDVIVSESQRLSRMIGNVLTFSRNERQLLTLHPSPGNAGDVLRNVASQFDTPLRNRGIHIDLDTSNCRVAAFDRDAFEQIAGNLLSNVEKYAIGGDSVRITCKQENDTLILEVADNGPGIPAPHHERIFKPFYRVSDRINDGVAGTGLGLTIARELARLHGGDLTLEPSERGAHFKITLHAPIHLMEDQS